MQITTIVAISGSAGASTTCTYVARMLAMKQQKVLVIDFNQFTEITQQLILDEIDDWLTDFQTSDFKFSSSVSHSKYQDIDVISLPKNHAYDYCEVQNLLTQRNIYQTIIAEFQAKYDHILIDISVNSRVMAKAAINASDKVLGVLDCQPQQINKVIPFLQLIATARVDKPLSWLKVLLNKVDITNIGCRLAASQYKKILPEDIKLKLYIHQFKYIKNKDRYALKVPTKSFQSLSTLINIQ
jgi:cellulose biosynthesis protein BcsQ